MTNLEFRRPRPDELAAFLAVPVRSYGSDDTTARLDWELLSNEPDRSIGALDDGTWVAAAGAFSLESTLPGGACPATAGVTMIGLEPTHRRRGILTRLLGELHADARRRAEPLAALTASETSIYRRFGYGPTADVADLAIDAAAVRFDPPPRDVGRFSMIDPTERIDVLADVHDRVRRSRPGRLSVTSGMWAQIAADPPFVRSGHGALRGVVHHGPNGTPDGYATWRIGTRSEPDRLAGNTLWIEHLTASDPEVEAALWGFIASIDLVTTVRWTVGPPDPAIRWRLVEPRRLRTRAVADMVWTRILDVATVLSARHYRTPGALTLAVVDRFHPDVGGTFRLACTEPGGPGSCERVEDVGRAVDLTIDVADLAPLVFGAVGAARLARVGRLSGSPTAIATAEAMFAVDERPWWPIEF